MVFAAEFGHEDGPGAGYGPSDADVGAAVHLAHDALEDAGAEFRSALVAKDQPSRGGMGEEGHGLGACHSEVVGGGGGAGVFEIGDEVVASKRARRALAAARGIRSL